MKKILSIVLVFVLAVSLCSCGGDGFTRKVRVEGSIFGGDSGSVKTKLKFDPLWLTEGDNTVYSSDIASFAALLSADVYFREKDLARGTQNRVLIKGLDPEDYTWTTMLSDLGFTDVRHIESVNDAEYETDSNDSVTLNLGYMQSGDCDIYVAAVRGCFSSGEWISAFDPGADTAEYTEYTGTHPEWINRQNFKGVDIASARAVQYINSFISEHEDASRKGCILVTGHSRGASIAQIVGAGLEKADIKSFAYTFNSTPCTCDADAENCSSIFNIVDDSDFLGNLFSFADEPTYRYGKTLHVKSIGDFLSEDMITEYSWLFARHFADRASLYQPEYITINFDDKTAADARVAELESIVSAETGLGLESLCSVYRPGDYSVEISYCGAAQLQCIGKVLAYGDTAAQASLQLFGGDVEFCNIIDFISSHSAEISAGHQLKNTYDLCKKL